MKILWILGVLLLTLSPTAIQDFIRQNEAAANARDVAAMVRFFAPTATITLAQPDGNPVTLNVPQYQALLQRVMPQYRSYRNRMVVSAWHQTGDRIQVNGTTYEAIDSPRLNAAANWEAEVQQNGDRLQFTRVRAYFSQAFGS
ncbi:MAG TPA: hypothetical protein DCQ32_05015 [Cyanobacteria bacterium UBA8156]|jgi:hypothetical protein|nr:hypothetical protein [Cyanobacteria bacterium UBA8156]